MYINQIKIKTMETLKDSFNAIANGKNNCNLLIKNLLTNEIYPLINTYLNKKICKSDDSLCKKYSIKLSKGYCGVSDGCLYFKLTYSSPKFWLGVVKDSVLTEIYPIDEVIAKYDLNNVNWDGTELLDKFEKYKELKIKYLKELNKLSSEFPREVQDSFYSDLKYILY
jgi:hypothetical protein